MIQKVKAATGDKIHVALDTISEEQTQFTAMKVLAEGVPGRLLIILQAAEGISDVRKDVEVICSFPFSPSCTLTKTSNDKPTFFTVTIIFSAYGFEFKPFGLNDDDRRELSEFLQNVPSLVKDRKFKTVPVKKFEGGLEKVCSDGYKYLADGRVSGEKVVFAL